MEFHRVALEPGGFLSARRACSISAALPQCRPKEDSACASARGAVGRDRLLQWPIEGKQIDVAKRRRLVEVLAVEAGEPGMAIYHVLPDAITDRRRPPRNGGDNSRAVRAALPWPDQPL